MYLDNLKLLEARVGYGRPGTRGALGYEDKSVVVQGRTYKHAVSAHAPSRLIFDLGRRFSQFRCQVALNDDVAAGRSYADFTLLADGRQVARESYVRAGEKPRPMSAEIMGAERLELLASTSRYEFCHSVWLDPQVIETPVNDAQPPPQKLRDCLGRVEIELPATPLRAERCIATIVSPGFEGMLDDMLGSLAANGHCEDALLVVFGVEADEQCQRVAEKYGAAFVRCARRARLNPTVKSVMYSAARIVDARYFICLDADMLVLGDLRPIFGALEACPEGTILACREANNGSMFNDLEHALCTAYGGRSGDIQKIIGHQNGEGAYPLVVNDGLFAAGHTAMLALDGLIRQWERAAAWVDERNDIWWRNQFVFNLALAHLGCGVELDTTYNVQLCWQDATADLNGDGRVRAFFQGKPARVLHFNGRGRNKCAELRGIFARVTEPLVGRGGGDNYASFLEAVRAWVGRHGVSALTWSFYGTTDGQAARVRDPSTLPLLALLHYLIRSNGCLRILEAGTAHGVSAACLASAVAHRQGGRVVCFDVNDYPRRAQFWATLPKQFQRCLEFRQTGSLEGMRAALSAGETFEAALLDSMHTEDHVWAEFQLAAQLVCPGGLILIHDVLTLHSTVEQALRRIEAAGYGVVRLWTAERGEKEDDHLGLAVIENRRTTAVRGILGDNEL